LLIRTISSILADVKEYNVIDLTAGSLLGFDSSLLAHSGENNDIGVLLVLGEQLVNLLANFSIRNLNIILSLTIIGHQREETIVRDVEELVFLADYIGNVHVMGRWAQFFELLASEDINGDKMDLSVTVLASLGGGHIDDLAGAVLDDDEAVLSQGRALHRESGGGASVGGVEGVLMLGIVGVDFGHFEGIAR